MKNSEILRSASRELMSYIDRENLRLKSEIDSTSLDEPDYHDYQTCAELVEIARELKQDEYCYPWAVPLQIYIIDKHNNNVSAFARSQGVQPNQVNRWLKRDCVVIDGKVYCQVSKAKKGKE